MGIIIATVGLCGAGKSVVTEFFENKGWRKVYFGGVVIDQLKKAKLEINEKNEKMMREKLRKDHGMGAMAVLTIDDINEGLKKGNVIVDGLYSYSEYVLLREKLGDKFIVIAVFCPKELRYERLAMRKIRPLSKQEVDSRDKAEIENLEKAQPIALADYTLINDSTVADLKKKVQEITNDLKI